MSDGVKNYNSTSGVDHEAAWETIELTGLSGLLAAGVNTLAVHGLNHSVGSTDFSFDGLEQSVQQPVSGHGVTGVTLDYQLVDPGAYVRLTDGACQASWTTVAMADDASEAPATQDNGNLWGLSLAVDHTGGRRPDRPQQLAC